MSKTPVACVYSAEWLVFPQQGVTFHPVGHASPLLLFSVCVVELSVQWLKERVVIAILKKVKMFWACEHARTIS